jgi:hypothetical protein
MLLFSTPWRNATDDSKGFCLTSCDPCGAFGGGDVTKLKEHIDDADNTTLSTNSPSRDSQQSSNNNTLEKVAENDDTIQSSVEGVETSACENIRYVVEDATLCVLDGVCCRRTCDDNDHNSLLPETCGGARSELRRRRRERAHTQSQLCCTVISWCADDEEDISVLQDPLIEESEYDGGLNRGLGGGTPEHSVVSQDNMETPKHRNSFRNKHEKCCAYCGVTKEEANHRMKICSRCRSTYYCSKDCQSEDWYNTHKTTCVPVENN